MGSESVAHETEGRMGYWLRGHEGERGARSRIFFFSNGWAYDLGEGGISRGGYLSDSLTYPASTGSVSFFQTGKTYSFSDNSQFFFRSRLTFQTWAKLYRWSFLEFLGFLRVFWRFGFRRHFTVPWPRQWNRWKRGTRTTRYIVADATGPRRMK